MNLPPSPEEVASEDEVELLKFGILDLDTPIERFSALYLLVESRKEESLPALWSLLPKSRHTDMQALLLHLVSLPQNPDDIARLQPLKRGTGWPEVPPGLEA